MRKPAVREVKPLAQGVPGHGGRLFVEQLQAETLVAETDACAPSSLWKWLPLVWTPRAHFSEQSMGPVSLSTL